MNEIFKVPPLNKSLLSSPDELVRRLQVLIGTRFQLTGKTRTDGSKIRKLIAQTLEQYNLPDPASENDYKIVPPKRKGVPKILLEYLDTYIVTTGNSYNLQVWNRNPSSESVQVEYKNGDRLISHEVRFVFVKVDPASQKIQTIVILSPDYIVEKFGQFGKPTIKHQLIISESARKIVLNKPDKILFHPDIQKIRPVQKPVDFSCRSIHDSPSSDTLLPLTYIKDVVKRKLIGSQIAPGTTKNRGQALEEKIVSSLGYTLQPGDLLAGGYPDLRHQALEIKVQDSPTVDLGMYSPEFEEDIPLCEGFKTTTIRYFLAFTDPATNVIEGGVLCPGQYLGQHFTYVGEKSYKCQRAIPMSFFDDLSGTAVFNP